MWQTGSDRHSEFFLSVAKVSTSHCQYSELSTCYVSINRDTIRLVSGLLQLKLPFTIGLMYALGFWSQSFRAVKVLLGWQVIYIDTCMNQTAHGLHQK